MDKQKFSTDTETVKKKKKEMETLELKKAISEIKNKQTKTTHGMN